MTIFIKPNATNFDTYYILAKFDETVPKLERVVFATEETEIVNFLDECNPTEDDRILFDGTIYGQTGIDLKMTTEIYIYRDRNATNANETLSKSSANTIAAQARWVAKNMHYSTEMKNDRDFQRFIRLIQDYKPTNPNCDSSAAELMAAAARYFRRRAQLDT
jgi:hypothetical protein